MPCQPTTTWGAPTSPVGTFSALTGPVSTFAACASRPTTSWGCASASTAADPILTSVTPSSSTQDDTIGVTLLGQYFVAGSTVQMSGASVVVSGVIVVDTEHITATFAIALLAVDGARTVTVTNP